MKSSFIYHEGLYFYILEPIILEKETFIFRSRTHCKLQPLNKPKGSGGADLLIFFLTGILSKIPFPVCENAAIPYKDGRRLEKLYTKKTTNNKVKLIKDLKKKIKSYKLM